MGDGEWTISTLKEHYAALRVADQRALQIKLDADQEALRLARESQTYRDEQANRFREQLTTERSEYVRREEWHREHQSLIDAVDARFGALSDKMEDALKPLNIFMASQQGRSASTLDWRTVVLALLVIAAALIGPQVH